MEKSYIDVMGTARGVRRDANRNYTSRMLTQSGWEAGASRLSSVYDRELERASRVEWRLRTRSIVAKWQRLATIATRVLRVESESNRFSLSDTGTIGGVLETYDWALHLIQFSYLLLLAFVSWSCTASNHSM